MTVPLRESIVHYGGAQRRIASRKTRKDKAEEKKVGGCDRSFLAVLEKYRYEHCWTILDNTLLEGVIKSRGKNSPL